MAFAVKTEISAVSLLLRGLCIRNQWSDAVKSRLFSAPAYCLPLNKKLELRQSSILTVTPSSTSNLLEAEQQHDTHLPDHARSGILFQQRRTYAKVLLRQKKKVSFDYSGDLVTQKPLNLQDTHVDLRNFTQVEDASEPLQKLCSLEFASGYEKKIHRQEEIKDRILHLFGNEAVREMHIAMLTVDIRNMIPHVLTCKKDKLSKARLVEKIQLRKKMLKYLRRTDYQRFMWLLQELRIRYVLPPDYHKTITKKYMRKKTVWDTANNLRLQKISELKVQLEAEKADFLKHKEETLKQIEEDAERYNLNLEEFEKDLKRKPVGKTYPRIYTWEERQQLEEGHPLKV